MLALIVWQCPRKSGGALAAWWSKAKRNVVDASIGVSDLAATQEVLGRQVSPYHVFLQVGLLPNDMMWFCPTWRPLWQESPGHLGCVRKKKWSPSLWPCSNMFKLLSKSIQINLIVWRFDSTAIVKEYREYTISTCRRTPWLTSSAPCGKDSRRGCVFCGLRTLEVCETEWVIKTLDLMFLVCEDYDLRGTRLKVSSCTSLVHLMCTYIAITQVTGLLWSTTIGVASECRDWGRLGSNVCMRSVWKGSPSSFGHLRIDICVWSAVAWTYNFCKICSLTCVYLHGIFI